MASVISSPRPNFSSPNIKSLSGRRVQDLPAFQQQQQLLEQDLDDNYQALFCKAMYDYTSKDASALSFCRGDIIEVLHQQPSGWWDGLLGDERGWFPSNYVILISLEEAEMAFSGSDYSIGDGMVQSDSDNGVLDMSDAMMQGQAQNEEWLESEISNENIYPVAAGSTSQGSQTNDFWEPNIMDDGRVCILLVRLRRIMLTSLLRYITSTHVQESTPGTYLRKQRMRFLEVNLLVFQRRVPSEQQPGQEWFSE